MNEPMRVSRQWIEDFDCVVRYLSLSEADVEECKQEVREHPEWARQF